MDLNLTYNRVGDANNIFVVVFSILLEILLPIALLCVLVYGIRRKLNRKPYPLSSFRNNFAYFYIDYPAKCYYWDFVRLF